MPRVRLVVLALLLTACSPDAASSRVPDPPSTTYYCGSYESATPGTVTSYPPAPC